MPATSGYVWRSLIRAESIDLLISSQQRKDDDGQSDERNDERPAAARAWACQVMLGDLNPRYPAHRLAHVRQRLADLQNARD